jgi:serine/threonine-protein kinase RsbT
MHWRQVETDSALGIELTVEDKGPGIPNIEQAMQQGYTTGNGLGLGLPGTKRLMNDMVIRSEVGRGTTVTVRRWRKR